MTQPPDSQRAVIVVTKTGGGGAMALPIWLAAELRKRGRDVEIWHLYRGGNAGNEPSNGVRIVLDRAAKGLLDYARIFLRLTRMLRAQPPSALLGVLPLANIFGSAAGRIAGLRVRIASQHNPPSAYSPAMRVLDWLAGTFGVYTANVAVSASVLDAFRAYPHRYRNAQRVIENAVSFTASDLDKDVARRRFALPLDVALIGTVGRLSAEKNPGFLLEAMARLPGVHLALCGEGELRAELEQTSQRLGIADRIHFLGWIAASQIAHVYRTFDVFVLPSRYEGMPLSLIEALQAGLPIVASDIPANKEVLLAEGRPPAGLLRDAADPTLWSEAVSHLLNDAEQRARLSDAAAMRARNFSLPRMVAAYEAMLFPKDKV